MSGCLLCVTLVAGTLLTKVEIGITTGLRTVVASGLDLGYTNGTPKNLKEWALRWECILVPYSITHSVQAVLFTTAQPPLALFRKQSFGIRVGNDRKEILELSLHRRRYLSYLWILGMA